MDNFCGKIYDGQDPDRQVFEVPCPKADHEKKSKVLADPNTRSKITNPSLSDLSSSSVVEIINKEIPTETVEINRRFTTTFTNTQKGNTGGSNELDPTNDAFDITDGFELDNFPEPSIVDPSHPSIVGWPGDPGDWDLYFNGDTWVPVGTLTEADDPNTNGVGRGRAGRVGGVRW